MKNNFGVLYLYECKKLLRRKIVWISFSVCLLIILASLVMPFTGDYYIDGKRVDSNYNMYQTDKNYAQALNGRKIDQNLMEETIAAYRKIPATLDKHYSSTAEYQQYARPYTQIFSFIRRIAGMQTSEVMYSWQPSEEDLYAKRKLYLESIWEDLGLSKGEMDFWQKREAQIKTPYIFQAHEGYSTIISCYQTVGIFVLMFIAICLSGMFSDEHTRKTDQIILSSPLGKSRLYWAKMTAGISFAAISTILFFVLIFATILCLYGAEGYQAAFQFIYPDNSDPITCGQAAVIAYGCLMAAAAVTGIFVMTLSELLHSNIASLAVSTGFVMISMIISVPDQYRVLAQIWNWLPWRFPSPWNVFGEYTLSIFGQYLTPWQAAPALYLFSGAVIAALGKPIYQRFQVSGR